MDTYSFQLIAMSMEDAKRTLGFPPDSAPSAAQVRDAYLQKAKSMHPDVGGDLEQMKELNVAKDILEGKARPTYDRRPETTYEPSTIRWEPPKPPKKVEVTFEEAESKAGIPSGVEWLFVTPHQYSKRGWSSDESSRSEMAFVAYGKTATQYVFAVAHHETRQDYYVGGTENRSVWTIKSTEIPIKAEEGKNPAWLYGHVVRALKDVKFEGRFNSKVLDAQGWKFGPREPAGSPLSIKHWLVESGQVAGDAPSVATRKHIVELYYYESYDPQPDWYKDEFNHYYQLVLALNGKRYEISKDDLRKALKLRIGGKRFFSAIFGTYAYSGTHKQLTRIRFGKQVIGWMATNFTDLPAPAVEILKVTEAQMKS